MKVVGPGLIVICVVLSVFVLYRMTEPQRRQRAADVQHTRYTTRALTLDTLLREIFAGAESAVGLSESLMKELQTRFSRNESSVMPKDTVKLVMYLGEGERLLARIVQESEFGIVTISPRLQQRIEAYLARYPEARQ